ncbi:MAG: hypothetical protein ACRDRT_12720 [Pseudonocardiaceae bacterium]
MSWTDRTPAILYATTAHAHASPGCADGGYTVETIQDRRTDPPTIEHSARCDTCHQAL